MQAGENRNNGKGRTDFSAGVQGMAAVIRLPCREQHSSHQGQRRGVGGGARGQEWVHGRGEVNPQDADEHYEAIERDGNIPGASKVCAKASEFLSDLNNEELKRYYTTLDRAVLSVASVFEDTYSQAKKRIDLRIRGEYLPRYLEEIIALEGKMNEHLGKVEAVREGYQQSVLSLEQQMAKIKLSLYESVVLAEGWQVKVIEYDAEFKQAEREGDLGHAAVLSESRGKAWAERIIYDNRISQLRPSLKEKQTELSRAMKELTRVNNYASPYREQCHAVSMLRKNLEDTKKDVGISYKTLENEVGDDIASLYNGGIDLAAKGDNFIAKDQARLNGVTDGMKQRLDTQMGPAIPFDYTARMRSA